MKEWAVWAAVLAGLWGLTACGGDDGDGSGTVVVEGEGSGNDDDIRVTEVETGDGRVVTCVIFKSINEGGISCDWAGAGRRESP